MNARVGAGSVWMLVAGAVVLVGGGVGVFLMSRGSAAPSEDAQLEFMQRCRTEIKGKVARPQTMEFTASPKVEVSNGMRWSGKLSYQDAANTVYSGGFTCTDANGSLKLEFEGLGGVLQ
jgi:hypothetical protein